MRDDVSSTLYKLYLRERKSHPKTRYRAMYIMYGLQSIANFSLHFCVHTLRRRKVIIFPSYYYRSLCIIKSLCHTENFKSQKCWTVGMMASIPESSAHSATILPPSSSDARIQLCLQREWDDDGCVYGAVLEWLWWWYGNVRGYGKVYISTRKVPDERKEAFNDLVRFRWIRPTISAKNHPRNQRRRDPPEYTP